MLAFIYPLHLLRIFVLFPYMTQGMVRMLRALLLLVILYICSLNSTHALVSSSGRRLLSPLTSLFSSSKEIFVMEAPSPYLEKPEDRRDKLPFTMYLLKDKNSQERKELGTFYLDPSTSCGDYIEIGSSHEEYIVRRVKFIYRYGSRNTLEVIRKKIDVTLVKSPKGLKNILQ